MLRISFDDISKSIKFSAFIGSGLLMIIAFLQSTLSDSIFWDIVTYVTGFLFFAMVLGFLMKISKPAFAAFNEWRKKNKRSGKNSTVKIFKYLFGKKTYFKIMLIIWLIVLLGAIDITLYFFGIIEDKKEKYKILANFGFMIITISAALIVSYFSRIFKKR